MTPRDIMLGVLAVAAALALVSVWRAHRDALSQFNLLDLLMENGRVSKIALTFMIAFAVTTWVIAYLAITGKLTEGYFTAYGLMWVGPLAAKVIFNKNDAPGIVTSTTTVQQTTEVTKP